MLLDTACDIYHESCYYQENSYWILSVMTVPDAGISAYLIMQMDSLKYNLYILDLNSYPFLVLDPSLIVQNFEAEPLEVAQTWFPSLSFNKQNYGF